MPSDEFHRIRRLPPYVFAEVNTAKARAAHRRRGHHRPRHGQPGQPDAAAHRRQAGRGGAGPAHPPLLGQQGHPRPAPRAGRLLRPPLRRRTGPGDRGRRHARLQGGAGQPRLGDHLARATPSWCPTRPIRSTSSASSSPAPRCARIPATPDEDMLRALDRAVRHSVPKPTALIVNFPSNPTAYLADLDFYREIVCVRPPARHLDHVGPRLRRDLLQRQRRRPRCCRSPAPRTSPSSSPACRRPTRCPAGAWASPPATRG